ncbi:SAM-dependent methyltransferase, partial [Nonomuraea longispora]|uniref:SAM-dependent methyltransferase n=1 Tax=Nonomuraea longispora TaxID=1848320 RepID=UPI00319D8DC3
MRCLDLSSQIIAGRRHLLHLSIFGVKFRLNSRGKAKRIPSHGRQAPSLDADLLGHRRAPRPPVGAAVPNVARMYDFWLGGKDFYEVDREAAAMVEVLLPGTKRYAR